jgi:UDP-N-acetyl-D-glucosamine dehydrogenase
MIHEKLTPLIRPATSPDGSAMRVGIIGLGYTGLPLALALSFARADADVVGYDIDTVKVATLRAGRSYLTEIPGTEVSASLGRFTPTEHPHALGACDAIVVCVPTPLTDAGKPDLRYVDAAFETIERLVRPGMLIVMQSTVPPGTTLASARTLAANSGLALGDELFVAAAPERIDPGNQFGWTVANTPRLVGGVTEECTRRAAELLEGVCTEVVVVADTTTAEMSKVFENTFRLVNIALTYELAAACDRLGVATNDVIDAAATKPFGFLAHRPGPGIGGECIPVDPVFLVSLAERSGLHLPLISAAHEHAVHRPHRVVERLASLLDPAHGDLAGSKVLLAGASYKPEIGDVRNAPSLAIVRELRRRGAQVAYADPFISELDVDGELVPRVTWTERAVAAYDCVVLLTPHSALLRSSAWSAAPLTLDTWDVLPLAEHVFVLEARRQRGQPPARWLAAASGVAA